MSAQYLEIAQKWIENPYFDESDRAELKQLLDKNDKTEIEERFYKDLEFGTGGLRSILGFGRNRMNKYNVRKATHAMALAMKDAFPGQDLKMAISYDYRRFSREFAEQAGCVLAANGISSFIFDEATPTPILSYAVRFFKAHAGIMITASHNPPNYNGFKAYWSDGAQVTPPNDQNVIDHYNKIEDFAQIPLMKQEDAEQKQLIHWVGEEVKSSYHQINLAESLNRQLCQEKGKEIKVVFTPLHGCGLVDCKRSVTELGISHFIAVPEQAQGDANFPTVKSPNPEDPTALKMAVDLMQKENADLVLATDPDTDRLGVALEHKGEVIFLNGNQIGIILLNYRLETLKQAGKLGKKPYVVKTIVTSPMQAILTESYGVEIENTLTGFKWICYVMEQKEKDPEAQFVFACEESFGYLPYGHVRDKDAVASAAIMSEACLYYKQQGKTLVDALDDLYEKHGFYYESLLALNYTGKEGADKIGRIMEVFRNDHGGEFAGVAISNIEDYQKGYKDIPKSNVLGFQLESGNKIYLRPSGTEPKIKFYVMVRCQSGNLEEKKAQAKKMCAEIEEYIKQVCEKA